MGFGRRRLVLLLLFFLVVSSSTGVPTSRSLKSVKHEGLVLPRNFQYQDWIKDWGNSRGLLKMEGLLGRRMNIELADYPETGANNNHDPRPPVRV